MDESVQGGTCVEKGAGRDGEGSIRGGEWIREITGHASAVAAPTADASLSPAIMPLGCWGMTKYCVRVETQPQPLCWWVTGGDRSTHPVSSPGGVRPRRPPRRGGWHRTDDDIGQLRGRGWGCTSTSHHLQHNTVVLAC
jgi:hypothetical protein